MEYVGGGVALLRLGEPLGPPIRRLLGLGKLDAEQFSGEVGEAMAIGVGARQAGGDLGAVNRGTVDIHPIFERGDIETGEMKQFETRGIGEQRGKVGCR